MQQQQHYRDTYKQTHSHSHQIILRTKTKNIFPKRGFLIHYKGKGIFDFFFFFFCYFHFHLHPHFILKILIKFYGISSPFLWPISREKKGMIFFLMINDEISIFNGNLSFKDKRLLMQFN